MNVRKWLIVSITVTLAMLLVLVVVGTVLGQEPEPITGPAQVEEGTGTEGELGVMARPAKTMNYQGYLTDNSGSPLNGSYNMVFSLWDEEGAWDAKWLRFCRI